MKVTLTQVFEKSEEFRELVWRLDASALKKIRIELGERCDSFVRLCSKNNIRNLEEGKEILIAVDFLWSDGRIIGECGKELLCPTRLEFLGCDVSQLGGWTQ